MSKSTQERIESVLQREVAELCAISVSSKANVRNPRLFKPIEYLPSIIE